MQELARIEGAYQASLVAVAAILHQQAALHSLARPDYAPPPRQHIQQLKVQLALWHREFASLEEHVRRNMATLERDNLRQDRLVAAPALAVETRLLPTSAEMVSANSIGMDSLFGGSDTSITILDPLDSSAIDLTTDTSPSDPAPVPSTLAAGGDTEMGGGAQASAEFEALLQSFGDAPS